MTYQDFDNFRLALFEASGDLTWKMAQKVGNDVRDDNNVPLYKQDMFIIYVLNRYIDIMLEYNPVAINVVDTNFFPVSDMLEFQRKINAILDMDWNLDFVLTS